MDNPLESPLIIHILPSKWVASSLIFTHAGGIFILLYLSILIWFKLLFGLIAAMSFVHLYRLHIWKKSDVSPVRLLLSVNDVWTLTFANGQTREVNLQTGAFVHLLLMVLVFNDANYHPVVILTSDMTNKDNLRRLRIRLKYKKGELGKYS